MHLLTLKLLDDLIGKLGLSLMCLNARAFLAQTIPYDIILLYLAMKCIKLIHVYNYTGCLQSKLIVLSGYFSVLKSVSYPSRDDIVHVVLALEYKWLFHDLVLC